MIESIPEEEILRDKNIKILLIRLMVTLLFGLMLLFFPKMGLDILFILVGLYFLIQGGASLILSLVNRSKKAIQPAVVIHESLQTLLGIILVLRPHWMVNLGINLLVVTMGVLIIAGNIVSILSDRTKNKRDYIPQIFFILMGLIMIFAPFFTAELLIRLLGAMILIFSLGDGLKLILLWKKPMIQP